MGLVVDCGVLIAAEREAKPVSDLLVTLEYEHAETEIVLSSTTVIELEHGLHRAQTAEQARKRREYLQLSSFTCQQSISKTSHGLPCKISR